MKAALLNGYGDTSHFSIAEISRPMPGPGEVLIQIIASAINPFDLILRQGLMSEYIQLPMPAILGGDAAGVIAAVGDGVTDFSIGQRVVGDFSANGRGAHAQFGVLPVTSIAELPGSLDFGQGAALVKAGLTGRQTADVLGVRPGDRVLVAGALGCVGRAAVQYLSELGAIPVAGVRTARLSEARVLTDDVIDLSISPKTPTFDFAISTAASAVATLFAHVRNGGTIASIVPIPDGTNQNSRITIHELRHRTDATMMKAILASAVRGELEIPVACTLSLDEIAQAHHMMAAGVRGKIILLH